mgnify:CR=1 FL=1
MPVLRILTAEGCAPCSEFKESLDAGRLLVESARSERELTFEIVDVTSEEGFKLLEELSPKGVPAAYLDHEQCLISFEKDDDGKRTVVVTCGEELIAEARKRTNPVESEVS